MKVAAPYTNDTRWKDIPDEYNLIYTESTKESTLTLFCMKYPEKRVNVLFKDTDIDINAIKKAKEYNQNIFVRVSLGQLSFIELLKQEKINFFLDYSYPCISFDLLEYAINIGSTDVYPYGDLWYQMDAVSKKCKENNLHIRLILNEIPSLNPDAGKDYTAPFFTPRDKRILEKYVDTVEFNCFMQENKKHYNWHMFNVCYKAWIIKEEWAGDLQELIPQLKIFIPVHSLFPNFVERRMNCRHRCFTGDSCKHCNQLIELAQNLNAEDLYIIHKKLGKNEQKSEVENDI